MFMAKMALLSRLCLLGAGTFLFFWCAPPNVERNCVLPNERKIALPLGAHLRRILWASLLIGLEFAVVFLDEHLDHRSAGKNAEPLFLVERDGETPHSVEGYGAFLADLETQPC